MTVRFERRAVIAAPVELVFDLSLDIDAHVASMSRFGERAVAGVTGGQIGIGQDVTWRARHFGIDFTMTTRITEMDRPQGFVDQQVAGPFRSFCHEHVFEAVDGGTVMIDRVRFVAPFGPIGWLVERAVLARYLEALIDQRGQYLQRAAERIGPAR